MSLINFIHDYMLEDVSCFRTQFMFNLFDNVTQAVLKGILVC